MTSSESIRMPRRSLRTATIAAVLGLGVLVSAAPARAADQAAGEKIAKERCAACHGQDGNTPIDPSYPKLSGQHADYLQAALRAYRDERRKNAIMGAQAKPLSNADIENLAAYYTRQPSQLSVRK